MRCEIDLEQTANPACIDVEALCTREAGKAGRPTDYSAELADLICDRLSEGRTLRSVCRDNDIPVSEKTVRRWAMNPRSPFPEKYELARLVGFLSIAEELIEIADDGRRDWVDREGRRGVMVRAIDYEHVERSKVRIETRKWLLARALPKLFGRHLPVAADGQAEDKGSGFIAVWRLIGSDLWEMLAAWRDMKEGRGCPDWREERLLLIFERLGCPTLKEVAPASAVKAIERAELLERYEVARLAYADDEEPKPRRLTGASRAIAGPKQTDKRAA